MNNKHVNRFNCLRNIAFIVAFLMSFNMHAQTNSAALTASDFFVDIDTMMVKLSPDGHRYALLKNTGEKASVIIKAAATQQVMATFAIEQYSNHEANINRFTWIDNQHVAVQFIESRKGVTDLLDTKAIKKLIILSIPNSAEPQLNVYEVRTNGWLVDPLIHEKNVFLYAKSSLYSKVYRIDVKQLALFGQPLNKLSKVDGGQFSKVNEVAKVSGFATKWFIDPQGQVRAVLHYTDTHVLSLSELPKPESASLAEQPKLSKEKEFSVVKTWDLDDVEDTLNKENKVQRLFPIALSNEDNNYYALLFDDNKQKTLYKINFSEGNQQEVFQSTGYQILDIVLNEQNKLLGIQVMKNGKFVIEYISAEEQGKELIANEVNVVISEAQNGETQIAYQESFKNPGEFFLTTAKKPASLIGERFPALKQQLSSELIESTVDVDGLAIPYLLHIPNKKSHAAPLIVFPHGGPIDIHDDKYYNPIVQLLVSAGYAVLQVNFRGSSGYTEEFKDAGKKHFGDLILNDIYQVTQTVIKLPSINRSRVCIFGMSYGGYAAISLGIQHPETFQCAASWAGVTDINLYLNSPQIHQKQQKWVKEYIGDSEKDFQLFTQQSPVYYAEKLNIPLLIAHGTKDSVVDIEHAYRMKLMLDKYQKNYQWLVIDDATHSFGSNEMMISFFDTLLMFLQNNLFNPN